MANPQQKRLSFAVIFGQLGWPLLFGAASTTLFYALVYKGPLNAPFFHRYFATHPVGFLLTGMFFVGVSALVIRFIQVLAQFPGLAIIGLPEIPEQGNSVGDCDQLLSHLDALPKRHRASYFGQRLAEALRFVRRTGSADDVAEELKYLSDADLVRQQDNYGLIRIIIWATPMLGFLGTVVGITQALGELATQDLGGDLKSAMNGLLAGLYVAFDTTALALTLSLAMMFKQFVIDMLETQLLNRVDALTNEQIQGRFEVKSISDDPSVARIEQMNERVVEGMQQLVHQQAHIWQSTIDAAHQQWQSIVTKNTDQMQTALAGALDQVMEQHAERLTRSEKELTEQSQTRWDEWASALKESTAAVKDQHTELSRQSELMGKAVEATGDVIKLETVLNDNLRQLAGAKHFEETVMSLAAAINLLNARLGATDANVVNLTSKERAA